MGWFDFMQEAIAIDLGTANTLIIYNDKVVVDEPSIVAKNIRTGDVVAIGTKAQQMHGKTHKEIETLRPLKDGVIADFQSSEQMIRGFIGMIPRKRSIFSPALKMVICIPSGVTEVEKRAVIDSAEHAGAKDVWLIHEPMAAAIGIGIDVLEPKGNMVIDIGGGTSDIAVISLSAIAYGESVRVAGDAIDESIARYMRINHSLNIGIFEAERIKTEIGSAYPLLGKLSTQVKGLNVQTGVPTSTEIFDEEIRLAMQEPILMITSVIMKALEKTPPELSADIHSNGIYLTGGGALIRGLDKLIEEQTSLKVYKPTEPLLSIVKGAGAVLSDYEKMKAVCIN